MAGKKRVARRKSSTGKRKSPRRAELKQTQSRALIAILALLLFLHLIDEKTFGNVTSPMKPKGRAKKRRSKTQHGAARKRKTRASSKSKKSRRS